jgi:hypothetical protein
VEAPAKGAVVLARFPSLTCRGGSSVAVVLADAGRGDRGPGQVTRKPNGDSAAVVLDDTAVAFATGARDQLRPTRKTVHGKQRSDDGTKLALTPEAQTRIVDAEAASVPRCPSVQNPISDQTRN